VPKTHQLFHIFIKKKTTLLLLTQKYSLGIHRSQSVSLSA
jgi:hypothetical protein